MENAIEICSGCGKMPRSIDTTGGQFVCIRCGNRSTIQVTTDDYEKVVTELDAKFHAHMQKQNLASARSEPIVLKKEAVRRKSLKRAAPKKATTRKATKKKQTRRK
jgi:hypothetical protein